MVISPSSMGPSASRTHLLPGMLQAVLSENSIARFAKNAGGGSLWHLRATLPLDLRARIARILPDQWATQLTARLEMRGWIGRRPGRSWFRAAVADTCGSIYPAANETGLWIRKMPIRSWIALDLGFSPSEIRMEAGGEECRGCLAFAQGEDIVQSIPRSDRPLSDRLPPHLAGVSSQHRRGSVAGWGSGRTESIVMRPGH
jgi:hypothetical protein